MLSRFNNTTYVDCTKFCDDDQLLCSPQRRSLHASDEHCGVLIFAEIVKSNGIP